METINVEYNTKEAFEKERFQLRLANKKLVSQDEFIKMLIKNWREK